MSHITRGCDGTTWEDLRNLHDNHAKALEEFKDLLIAKRNFYQDRCNPPTYPSYKILNAKKEAFNEAIAIFEKIFTV